MGQKRQFQRDEVTGFLAQIDGITALLAKLLYGTGMRLIEGKRLRIEDVDFLTATSSSFARPKVARIAWSCCRIHWHRPCVCKCWRRAAEGTASPLDALGSFV
jgi:hypothetical protein